jgi:cyclophilin family peptidyl-prolyl cis-trans isomerase
LVNRGKIHARHYTVIGAGVSGMEVVHQISATPADGDKAKDRGEMQVTIRGQVIECPVTPADEASWGRVKTIFR